MRNLNRNIQNFMDSYKEILSSNGQKYENVRRAFLNKKKWFCFSFYLLIFICIILNTKLFLMHQSPNVIQVLFILESIILLYLGIMSFFAIDKNYRKKMKTKFLKSLLKDFFNIENGSHIPINYFQEISYIRKEYRGLKIEKKTKDDSFHGEYNGIKFQVEEAYLSAQDPVAHESRKSSFLLLLFELNKTSYTKIEINPTQESLSQMPKNRIYKIGIIIFLTIVMLYLILSSNWNLIIEDNIYLTTLTEDFLPIIKICKFIYIICFPVLNTLFILFCYVVSNSISKIKRPELSFNTNGKQVKSNFLNILNELNQIYRANGVSGVLIDNKLAIAVETNCDLFEIGDLNTPSSTFYKELKVILKIIDYLEDNNENITY